MDRIDTFLELYGEPLSPRLAALRERAEAAGVPIVRPQMQQYLRFLIRTEKPKRALEIGCAVGFSSLLMAEAANRSGGGSGELCIETIERAPERIEEALENFRAFGYGDPQEGAGVCVRLLEGDAARLLPGLPTASYDLIFLDAAKGQYPSLLPELKRLLAPGGRLLADNLFQDGDVFESRYAVRRRDRTIHERMREFLYAITHDPELETCILTIADGVSVCVKK